MGQPTEHGEIPRNELKMSNGEEKTFVERLDTMSKLVTLIKVMLGGAFAVGLWVATLEYRHRTAEKHVGINTEALRDIVLWKERTEANRFDAKAANELANNFSNRANAQDLRMQKIESGQDEMKRLLEKIDSKLQ